MASSAERTGSPSSSRMLKKFIGWRSDPGQQDSVEFGTSRVFDPVGCAISQSSELKAFSGNSAVALRITSRVTATRALGLYSLLLMADGRLSEGRQIRFTEVPGF